ncbi:hypothetical protein ANANG_G00130550 [Anguilla anguilla]|uniref:Uncharacterized protein n=1 Tax=Anguilla anguilla TaxID=7936 RepID=A0A9D3MHU8_ANGAN|nr:hypothetical protein ANANG_G00130550 [Anguilla anguilla]
MACWVLESVPQTSDGLFVNPLLNGVDRPDDPLACSPHLGGVQHPAMTPLKSERSPKTFPLPFSQQPSVL